MSLECGICGNLGNHKVSFKIRDVSVPVCSRCHVWMLTGVDIPE